MIDLEILKSKGVSSEGLKKLFDGKTRDQLAEGPRKWLDRMSSRIQSSIDWNLSNYQTYHALDVAWDTPFRQISASMIEGISGKDSADESVLRVINDFGLTSLISTHDVKDPKTGRISKIVNSPMFYRVTAPLVRSYTTIRWAKVVNDRRLVPFFKYEPVKDTPKNRLRGEVITDRVQKVSTQYGYFDVLRQAVFHMLHYSFALQFPVEEWHTEEQLAEVDGKTQKKVVKEGLRYHIPHPTRCFWDKAHRMGTLNTDSGISWLGYWRIFQYREIKGNKDFWNTEKISIGDHDWINQGKGYFATVDSSLGCTLQFPDSYLNSRSGMELDRETIMANKLYTSDLDDAAVTLTEYFEKLIPSEFGFGDYDYPVWFRFVIASDHTVCYAAPLPYTPGIYYGYDAHEGRSQNASLSLEVQPYQDMVSNQLSQLILSTKQNLANVNFVDTDQVDEKDISVLENWGERLWRGFNIIRYSSRKWRNAQTNLADAFKSSRFPQQDTTSQIAAIKIVLDILERTLVMSSQELAQAASHEQTREEVRQVAATTSSRLTFTANPVDTAIHAWKTQIYQGLMAYGEDETYAQVEGDTVEEMTEEELNKLGFTTEEKPVAIGRKATLKAKNKTAIALEDFTSTREGEDRIDNVAAATAMSNFLIGLLNNPLVAPTIGKEQAITMLNLICRLAGFPRDFKLKATNDTEMVEQQDKEARNELLKAAEEISQKAAGQAAAQSQAVIMQQVGQSLAEVKAGFEPVTKALRQTMETNKGQDDAIAQILKTLEIVEKTLTALTAPPQPPAAPPPVVSPEYALNPASAPVPAQGQVPVGSTPAIGLV